MVKCAALNCTNYWGKTSMPRTTKFHRFPKNPKIRKEWIKFCGHRADVNLARDGICSEHFEDRDYRLQDLLLNIPLKKRHLKEDAVPRLATENLSGKEKQKKGLNESLEDPLSIHERSIDDCLPNSPESKWVLTELLVEPIYYQGCSTKNEQNDLLEAVQKSMKTGEIEIVEKSATTEPALNIQSETIRKKGTPGISESMTQTGDLEKLDKAVQTEIEYEVGLEFTIINAETEARKLKAALMKAIKKRRREESKAEILKKMFTPGQLRRLREPNKKFSWSDEDYIAAQELYSAGIRSYNILRERGFPLPGASLQRKWFLKAKAKLKADPKTKIALALEAVSRPKPISKLKSVSRPKSVSRSKPSPDTELAVALESILPPEPELAPKPIKEREIQIFWSEFMKTIE